MNDQLQETPYQRWYRKHKQELADKRKIRYHSDPEYRQKALERKHQQMEKAKELRTAPPGYTYSLQSVAEGLEVTAWTLREWRKKKYYPEPMRVGRNILFTENQFQLLDKLHDFLRSHGKRLSRANREKLEDVTNFIHANWT